MGHFILPALTFADRHMTPRPIWLLLAGGTALTATASLGMTVWLDLHPCHLCIFQRLLFMLLAGFACIAAFGSSRWRMLVMSSAFAMTSLVGMGIAAYQSWLQWQPPGSISCVGGQPGLIERFVEWLGQLQPTLFLATGFCEDVETTILGLSLANLALLAYLGCFVLGLWAMELYGLTQREISR